MKRDHLTLMEVDLLTIDIERVIKWAANDTSTGTYYIYAENLFPGRDDASSLFNRYAEVITEIMMDYDSIMEADIELDLRSSIVTSDVPDNPVSFTPNTTGKLDSAILIVMDLRYCPNYERTQEDIETGLYPENRIILTDPLVKKLPSEKIEKITYHLYIKELIGNTPPWCGVIVMPPVGDMKTGEIIDAMMAETPDELKRWFDMLMMYGSSGNTGETYTGPIDTKGESK